MTTMLEMRTSERTSLGHCAQQWYWSTVEELRPNRPSNPLWFGSAVHEALAAWYLTGLKRGPHPAETFDKVLQGDRSMIVTSEDEEQEYVDARALGNDMLTRYVEHYGNDDKWDVIATEHAGSVVIPRPRRKVFDVVRPRVARWLRYYYTWDGVFRDLEDGQIKLMEHKTAAAIRTDHLPLDNQAGSYWAIASAKLSKSGLLKPGEDVVGIQYNFLRKAMADLRPRNADGHYTNKPVKQHYVDAINATLSTMPDNKGGSWLGPGLTGKETLAQLEDIAMKMELTVLGEVSKSQPPLFFERHDVYRTREERRTQIRRIQDEALFAEAYRNGYLPVTKTPSKDCSWCPFSRMCELDEQGDQEAVETFKETQFHRESHVEVYRTKSA